MKKTICHNCYYWNALNSPLCPLFLVLCTNFFFFVFLFVGKLWAYSKTSVCLFLKTDPLLQVDQSCLRMALNWILNCLH